MRGKVAAWLFPVLYSGVLASVIVSGDGGDDCGSGGGDGDV